MLITLGRMTFHSHGVSTLLLSQLTCCFAAWHFAECHSVKWWGTNLLTLEQLWLKKLFIFYFFVLYIIYYWNKYCTFWNSITCLHLLFYYYLADRTIYRLRFELVWSGCMCVGNTKGGGKYHCTVDLLFDWFGISCMITDNFCFYLQNRQIQTSQTGGQWYSDNSPFSIPCPWCVPCTWCVLKQCRQT